MSGQTQSGKSDFIQCLTVTCPMGVALDSCPVKLIRTFPLNKRMAIVRQMTLSQKDAIIDSHRKCLAFRAQLQREKKLRYALAV